MYWIIRVQVHVFCVCETLFKTGEDMFHPLLQKQPSNPKSISTYQSTCDQGGGSTLLQDHHSGGDLFSVEAWCEGFFYLRDEVGWLISNRDKSQVKGKAAKENPNTFFVGGSMRWWQRVNEEGNGQMTCFAGAKEAWRWIKACLGFSRCVSGGKGRGRKPAVMWSQTEMQ